MSETRNEAQEAQSSTGPEVLVISRLISAPRELVWKVHSEVEHLKQWWGPAGLTIDHATLDFRPGGVFHYHMSAPNGCEMWGKFVYREIEEPSRLVFLSSFSNEQADTLRPPFEGEWTEQINTDITFEDQGDKTLLIMHGTPFNATESERQFFLSMHGSMNEGFGGTFGKLEAYLRVLRSV